MSSRVNRVPALVIGFGLLGLLAVAAFFAPDFLSTPDLKHTQVPPWDAPPFGTDERGIPLHEYAMQGARIVTLPSLASGMFVALVATFAGLLRCSGAEWIDSAVQAISEVVGSLPRLVVILVVILLLPADWRTLWPVGLAWAMLAAPGAMDEAAATAGRLGGERFVEALRAHGFSLFRIYLVHVIAYNLRPVIIRQAAEVTMQVVFLEIALSYLALRRNEPSFTHADSEFSWATLLYQGYTALLGADLYHSMALGLFLVGMVAAMSQAFRLAARPR